ncbi:hypothetical protein H8A99_11130 [Bradyrhizobium sp. Arg68]|uniref:STM3941 family protein n=1 Tax=Bradyrhizobium ivorense TaxID=2511166 RepID=UPI001E43D36C|nr:STM3941 family protein [Bradyrhizobium ivorense]MCC8937019.1 hypothetical protein [Bradyrhizobium ivorense]
MPLTVRTPMLRKTYAYPPLPDVEIGYSLVRLVGWAGVFVLMLVLCTCIALGILPHKPGDTAHLYVGYGGMVLFAVAIWKSIRIFMSPRAPVIVVSRHGIRDSRTSHGLIPWHSVEAISLWQSRANKSVLLKLSPAAEAHLYTTRTMRFVAWSNRLLGGDGIMIGTTALTMDTDELFDLCRTYHEAALRSPQAGVDLVQYR